MDHERPMPDLPATENEWALVGEIVGVFGVRGEVKVRPLSDFPERFAVGATLYRGDHHTPHTITKARLRPGSHVIGLSGVESANDAERLRGQFLSVPIDALSPLAPDQFYQHDMLGLRVERLDGTPLGVIADILDIGPNDIYVVRDERTGTERMLPAVKAFIKQVDIGAGVVRVEPIPGLFDDEADEVR
ncbi:MAG TPA: ribosome maturation factor RimM [Ktedonobacterales bacterium]|nr:ribosome maturation factor RimM [Ktedonobacterales bacterium]